MSAKSPTGRNFEDPEFEFYLPPVESMQSRRRWLRTLSLDFAAIERRVAGTMTQEEWAEFEAYAKARQEFARTKVK